MDGISQPDYRLHGFAALCHGLAMTVQTEDGFILPAWSFGDRIRKARDIAGMNQRDFAAAIEAKEGSLAAWETDRAKPRDIVAVAKRVAILTRIPPAWLLGVDEPTPPVNGPQGGGTPSTHKPNG